MADVELMVLVGSQFSMKAMAALEYKEIPYRLRKIAPTRLKKDVPGGMVPVMVWDGEVVKDSTTIMQRLDEAVPEPALFPQGRDDVAALEDEIDTSFNNFLHFYRWVDREGFDRSMRPAIQRLFPPVIRAIMPRLIHRQMRKRFASRLPFATAVEAREALMAALRRYDAMLEEQPFLCGDAPTAADIGLYGMMQGLDGDHLPGYPGAMKEAGCDRLQAWFERMKARAPIDFQRRS